LARLAQTVVMRTSSEWFFIPLFTEFTTIELLTLWRCQKAVNGIIIRNMRKTFQVVQSILNDFNPEMPKSVFEDRMMRLQRYIQLKRDDIE
jgi:hypothetical protein